MGLSCILPPTRQPCTSSSNFGGSSYNLMSNQAFRQTLTIVTWRRVPGRKVREGRGVNHWPFPWLSGVPAAHLVGPESLLTFFPPPRFSMGTFFDRESLLILAIGRGDTIHCIALQAGEVRRQGVDTCCTKAPATSPVLTHECFPGYRKIAKHAYHRDLPSPVA